MSIVAIIQARMGSSRLFGKVLKKVNNITLLELIVDRVSKSKKLSDVIVATTKNPRDDIIVNLCKRNGFKFFRGSEKDVLERYYEVAKKFNVQIIVRITADCPLIDPQIIDKVIESHLINKSDYTGNNLKSTYPRGLDVEVFNFSVLEISRNKAKKQSEHEHVTPYIYQNPEKFKITHVTNYLNMGHHRWTVDTPEDLQFIKAVLDKFRGGEVEARMDEVYKLVEDNPNIFAINSHIKQKNI